MSKTIQAYAFEIYYENVGNIAEVLKDFQHEFGYKFICSPVHDKDVTNPTFEFGEWICKPKKPHYHVLVHRDDDVDIFTLKEFARLYSNPHIENIYDEYGYFLYLKHTHPRYMDKVSYEDKDFAFVSTGYQIPLPEKTLGHKVLEAVDYFYNINVNTSDIELQNFILSMFPNSYQILNSTAVKERIKFHKSRNPTGNYDMYLQSENERLCTELKALRSQLHSLEKNNPF